MAKIFNISKTDECYDKLQTYKLHSSQKKLLHDILSKIWVSWYHILVSNNPALAIISPVTLL